MQQKQGSESIYHNYGLYAGLYAIKVKMPRGLKTGQSWMQMSLGLSLLVKESTKSKHSKWERSVEELGLCHCFSTAFGSVISADKLQTPSTGGDRRKGPPNRRNRGKKDRDQMLCPGGVGMMADSQEGLLAEGLEKKIRFCWEPEKLPAEIEKKHTTLI